ncbi:DUF2589 domain-containing protein [Chromobacterium sinusclupearum]|uniref:DUF2589 domain-containing protein n=1 Tax=Chromobacterium sinusclupearum TaxID=2077146 RepID=A0A2K4MKB9_9NEIS|nr:MULTISPECIES: DUF2589 domain-containing protein [Chromobacterium]OHX15776.1 hypothetical protein BI343_17565 [Chromobacterium amazonense]POA97459.1 DUF2589 domain-containing protein [Chromobacterium sinusclupearum]
MPDTNDEKLLSMAQHFSGLPMKALIGGPLQAAVQAQHGLALAQTQTLLETGFSRVTDAQGKLTGYRPLTAAIELSASNGPASSALTLNLPVMTLLQLPALAIQSVDIAFDMEVKSSFERETNDQNASKQEGDATWDARAGWGVFGVELKGTVARASSQTRQDKQDSNQSNSAHYHVEIKAEQQAMPEGVKLLLQAFSKTLETRPLESPPSSQPSPPLAAKSSPA